MLCENILITKILRCNQQVILRGIIDNKNHFTLIVLKNMLKAKISF